MKKIFLCVLLFLSFNTLVFAKSDISYTETLESFDNPERGFYQYFYYNFKEENNDLINTNSLKDNLLHLRLGLKDFSKQGNGLMDKEISQDALDNFANILKTIKSNGGSAIIRFSYDNFLGDKNMEPSLSMILKHVEQLSKVITKYQDVIAYVELGFFGPWGEMHSSTLCTEKNISIILDKMLDSTPENLKVGVRHPGYYADFANILRSELNKNITIKGTKYYRIGIFNDGYLGSNNDLGTYQNRDVEISWLEKQALHTFFGGEVVANSTSNPINNSSYMINEAFKTHTTYLNKDWNKTVIDAWKKEKYEGDDLTYIGESGYKYILNHLGYRFVLRNSYVPDNVYQNEKISISLDIENVGFGNLINSKKVTILLVQNDLKFEIDTSVDATLWNSRETSNINLNVSLPENIKGTFDVYLRISKYGNIETDNNYQCIRLANNDIWNEDSGANYIGTFSVLEKIQNNEEIDNSNEDINDNAKENINEDKIEDVIKENNTIVNDKEYDLGNNDAFKDVEEIIAGNENIKYEAKEDASQNTLIVENINSSISLNILVILLSIIFVTLIVVSYFLI